MTTLILGVLLGFLILVPIGAKWNIHLSLRIPAGFLIGLVAGVLVWRMQAFLPLSLVAAGAIEIPLIVVFAASLLLWRFYRDPERKSSSPNDAILSPADGTIVYVKEVESGMLAEAEKKGTCYPLKDFVKSNLLQESGTLIGIGMNFLDVHVNRSPMNGTVLAVNMIEGGFCSLRKLGAPILNQRQITIIEESGVRIAVVQIASRLVRRIISFQKAGDRVKRGERIGAIRFGSQVDLFLPNGCRKSVTVRPGQQVKAGLTVVAS